MQDNTSRSGIPGEEDENTYKTSYGADDDSCYTECHGDLATYPRSIPVSVCNVSREDGKYYSKQTFNEDMG